MTLVKIKVATVTVAAGLAVAAAGVASHRALATAAGDGPPPTGRIEELRRQIADLQEELRRAEKAAARDTAAARQDPVAVIFGDITITRGELGDHLLRRLTRDQVQQYVNLRVIEHATRAAGVTVTDREVESAFVAERAAVGGSPAVFDAVLARNGKTLAQWQDDVIRPRLLLEQLARRRVRVTEQDLRRAYEARYGEQVECQMIFWPAAEREKAERLYPLLRDDPARFSAAARAQSTPALAAVEGRQPPFGRHTSGDDRLDAVFRLQPDEVSPLIETGPGLAVFKCLRRIPADTTKRFEDVRAALEQEVRDRLVKEEIGTVFKELSAQARPRMLWMPAP